MKKIVVTIPNPSAPGGVNFFWDALIPHLNAYNEISLATMEVGGYGKNIVAPFMDQIKFNQKVNSKIDLVVLNPSLGFKSFFRDALFAKQLARKKKPFIVFFHGWDLDFEKKVSEKYVRFFNNSFGRAKKIIVFSNDFKCKLLEWGYSGEIIIETTAVDNALLKERGLHHKTSTNTKTKILFLSRLIKAKGIYETIEAFRNIRKDFNAELVVAGDGEEYDNISRLIAKDEDITMMGRVEGNEKIDVYRKSSIYCLPSYTEGLPTTVLEAMAFGIPVITTPVGGLKDFFQEGKMGYFVEPKSSKQIADKLRLLLSNKSEAVQIGKFNNQYANENLTGQQVAKRVYHYLTVGDKYRI
jgi:glycosyltransferase involved in cell wall biosynthesis